MCPTCFITAALALARERRVIGRRVLTVGGQVGLSCRRLTAWIWPPKARRKRAFLFGPFKVWARWRYSGSIAATSGDEGGTLGLPLMPLAWASPVLAHSGGPDAHGCHKDSIHGGYAVDRAEVRRRANV